MIDILPHIKVCNRAADIPLSSSWSQQNFSTLKEYKTSTEEETIQLNIQPSSNTNITKRVSTVPSIKLSSPLLIQPTSPKIRHHLAHLLVIQVTAGVLIKYNYTDIISGANKRCVAKHKTRDGFISILSMVRGKFTYADAVRKNTSK
jgi:hypothetical protein